MCPYAAGDGPARLMDDDLYARIVAQLASAGNLKMVTPMLQNEPLLDLRLEERVATARRALGRRVRIMLVTNGSPMTGERARSLVDAGVDAVAISLDALTRETYEAIRPGLDFDRVNDNALGLLRYRDRIDVEMRFLLQKGNRAELPAFRRFWQSRGARVSVQEVTNRADTLSNYGQVHARRARRLRDILRGVARTAGGRFYPACVQPFLALAVLADGRAIVCCHDWGPREVVGDLSREALDDVWNGKEMNRFRQLLVERRFERSAACADCSVVMQCGPGAGRQ
jgi:radical SAM protein with 4Fe4S-binding SPASM domain